MKTLIIAMAIAAASLNSLAASTTGPIDTQHITAANAHCDEEVTFKVKGSLDSNYRKALNYTKQKVYIADTGPFSIARGDLYNDMRPSAIVVSHPYPTSDVGFFKIVLQQQNQNTTKVTVYYHQDNPDSSQLLDEIGAALNDNLNAAQN